MGEINFKYLGKLIVGSAIVVTFLLWISKDTKRENATYTIVSGNDRTYYAQTFRMMGKGIVFDDVYGKKIILMGDIDIQYKNKDL
jgi:hypothetical protein